MSDIDDNAQINFNNMTVQANVVNFEIWEKQKKFTVYKVVISCDGKTWCTYKRYNEFSKLCDLVS